MNADHIERLTVLRDAFKEFGGGPANTADVAALDYAIERLSVAQGQGWLPIESAPSGVPLFLYYPRNRKGLGHLEGWLAEWFEVNTLEKAMATPFQKPTHYMLAAAPARPDGVQSEQAKNRIREGFKGDYE